MTKFDTLNLTAPHTMRELEQSECETAAAMRARKIAAMVEEDRWLDGEAGNPVSGVDHVAAAADMLAAWNEWFNGFGGDREKADRLACASCFAYEAVKKGPDPDTAPLAIMRAFLQAMVDPMHEDLDYLRRDPKAGAVARQKRALAELHDEEKRLGLDDA